jgi:hypothetical protein
MGPQILTETPVGEAVLIPARILVEVVRVALEPVGSLWLRVTGQSMYPIIREGDSVLLVRPIRVRAGEVVLVDSPGGPLLHRVTCVCGTRVRTRGDACRSADPEVDVGAIIAKALLARRGARIMALTLTRRFGWRALGHYLVANAQVRAERVWLWLSRFRNAIVTVGR